MSADILPRTLAFLRGFGGAHDDMAEMVEGMARRLTNPSPLGDQLLNALQEWQNAGAPTMEVVEAIDLLIMDRMKHGQLPPEPAPHLREPPHCPSCDCVLRGDGDNCPECDQLIAERDRAQDALQATHIAMGGDGEWIARMPPVPPPHSGDLHLDVPALAEAQANRIADLQQFHDWALPQIMPRANDTCSECGQPIALHEQWPADPDAASHRLMACRDLLHVFQYGAVTCLCGAVTMGSPSNTDRLGPREG